MATQTKRLLNTVIFLQLYIPLYMTFLDSNFTNPTCSILWLQIFYHCSLLYASGIKSIKVEEDSVSVDCWQKHQDSRENKTVSHGITH